MRGEFLAPGLEAEGSHSSGHGAAGRGLVPARDRVQFVAAAQEGGGVSAPRGSLLGGVPCRASEAQGCPTASSGTQLLRKVGWVHPRAGPPQVADHCPEAPAAVCRDPRRQAQPQAERGP